MALLASNFTKPSRPRVAHSFESSSKTLILGILFRKRPFIRMRSAVFLTTNARS